VRLSPGAVEVLDGLRAVARHADTVGEYAEVLVLDHYWKSCCTSPALPGAAGRSHGGTVGTRFGETYPDFDLGLSNSRRQIT
jgi:hypothetical protein